MTNCISFIIFQTPTVCQNNFRIVGNLHSGHHILRLLPQWIHLTVSYDEFYTFLRINNFHFSADVIYRLYEKTYTVPYIRVIPFQAGMIVGYMANWHRKDPIKAKPIFIILAWILLIGYLLAPIIASSDVDSISPLICAIMYSIGKFVYGLAIGGVILLCLIASQSTIPKILSHKLFVHLNKLCYGMFLVHPIVVLLLFGLRTQAATLSASLVVRHLSSDDCSSIINLGKFSGYVFVGRHSNFVPACPINVCFNRIAIYKIIEFNIEKIKLIKIQMIRNKNLTGSTGI